MTDRPITIGEIQHHAATISAMAAEVLEGLASGKYDKQIEFTEHMLAELGLVFPPAAEVEFGLKVFLFLNKMTAGRGPIIPDGRGGFVTKSWIDDPRHKLNSDGTFTKE